MDFAQKGFNYLKSGSSATLDILTNVNFLNTGLLSPVGIYTFQPPMMIAPNLESALNAGSRCGLAHSC